MATIVASPADRKASERKFYSRMALFLVFVVFLGFAPSDRPITSAASAQ